MTTDTADKPEPCHLVYSEIIHNRHGSPAHELRKPGFSVLLDLDRLDEADRISRFFSVNKFNLISFHEADFGPNHKSQRTKTGSLISLSAYIRSLAEDYFDPAQIKKIEMLAFLASWECRLTRSPSTDALTTTIRTVSVSMRCIILSVTVTAMPVSYQLKLMLCPFITSIR